MLTSRASSDHIDAQAKLIETLIQEIRESLSQCWNNRDLKALFPKVNQMETLIGIFVQNTLHDINPFNLLIQDLAVFVKDISTLINNTNDSLDIGSLNRVITDAKLFLEILVGKFSNTIAAAKEDYNLLSAARLNRIQNQSSGRSPKNLSLDQQSTELLITLNQLKKSITKISSNEDLSYLTSMIKLILIPKLEHYLDISLDLPPSSTCGFSSMIRVLKDYDHKNNSAFDCRKYLLKTVTDLTDTCEEATAQKQMANEVEFQKMKAKASVAVKKHEVKKVATRFFAGKGQSLTP